MIADNDIGTAVLPGVSLKVKGGVDLTVQQLHDLHKAAVKKAVGRIYLPGLELFLLGLFHEVTSCFIGIPRPAGVRARLSINHAHPCQPAAQSL